MTAPVLRFVPSSSFLVFRGEVFSLSPCVVRPSVLLAPAAPSFVVGSVVNLGKKQKLKIKTIEKGWATLITQGGEEIKKKLKELEEYGEIVDETLGKKEKEKEEKKRCRDDDDEDDEELVAKKTKVEDAF